MSQPPPLGNTLARVSLIFGLLDCVVLPVVGQWVAIITGHWARAQIPRRHASMDTVRSPWPG